MRWRDICRLTHSRLRTQTLRSGLAMLGIGIGALAVVTLTGSASMAQDAIADNFRRLGDHAIAIHLQAKTRNNNQEPFFTPADKSLLRAPNLGIQSFAFYTQKTDSIQLGKDNKYVSVIGLDHKLLQELQLKIDAGRSISDWDKGAGFCMIGHKLADLLHAQGIRPVGHRLWVKQKNCVVIGTLQHWPPSYLVFWNANTSVFMPLSDTTGNKNNLGSHVFMHLKNTAGSKKHILKIKNQLALAHPESRVDTLTPENLIKIATQQNRQLGNLLLIVGLVTLMLAGIGMSSSMLASLRERRREIAVSMALGAKRSDVLLLSLYETALLSVVGGTAGSLLGVLLSNILASVNHWPHTPLLGFFFTGIALSALTGLTSGIYPAWKAANMEPIQALREQQG